MLIPLFQHFTGMNAIMCAPAARSCACCWQEVLWRIRCRLRPVCVLWSCQAGFHVAPVHFGVGK